MHIKLLQLPAYVLNTVYMVQYKQRRHVKRLSHDEAVGVVRAYHEKGESQTSIARRLGVSQSTVQFIVHGDSHREAFYEVFPGLKSGEEAVGQ